MYTSKHYYLRRQYAPLLMLHCNYLNNKPTGSKNYTCSAFMEVCLFTPTEVQTTLKRAAVSYYNCIHSQRYEFLKLNSRLVTSFGIILLLTKFGWIDTNFPTPKSSIPFLPVYCQLSL